MELPAHSEAVLELGRRMVAQLNIADDLLAQWMAHDIAARIAAVEATGDTASLLLRDECAKSILSLWKHRNELPEHLRAFRELEPVIRTLVALDVDNGDDHRYFPAFLREAAIDDAGTEVKHWLELAFAVDYSARLLIQFALRSAARNSVEKARPWVEAALEAGVDPITERLVVEFYAADQKASDSRASDHQKDVLDKIARLEGLGQLATYLATELRAKHDIGSQSSPGRDATGALNEKHQNQN